MSISVNELRAENWILGEEIHLYNQNIHSNGYTKITAYGIYMLSENPELAAKYNPIPLTPDLLLACGFEPQYDEDIVWHELELRAGPLLTEGDKNGKCEVFFDCFEKIRVQHLHQLQNLYFALVGKELDVKL